MYAMVRDTWGGPEVLRLAEVSDPAIQPGHVLVRVHRASVNAVDWHRLRGLPYVLRLSDGIRRPKDRFLGADVSGTVVAIGEGVTRFAPGDEVMGQTIRTFAELVSARESSLVRKPAAVSFDDAAATPLAGFTALQSLRKAGMRPGTDVLILGAGGGVGSFAVQIARALGAASVTATTRADAVGLVASLGADEVLDYAIDDGTGRGARFDVVVDASGVLSQRALRSTLRPGGTAVVVGLSPFSGHLVEPLVKMRGPLLPTHRGTTVLPILVQRTTDDLQTVADLLETGALRPAIDSIHPLADTAAALARLGTGAARGKIVIAVS